jgi:hypothetical protein
MLATPQLESLPRESGSYRRHALVFVGILLLHLLAIRAFWMGLANSSLRDVQMLQIDVIPVDKPEKRPLPLPPVNLKEYRAVQVVTPEINISIAEDLPPTIQVTSLQKESTLLQEPAAPPAQAAVPTVPSVRPRPIYVRRAAHHYDLHLRSRND